MLGLPDKDFFIGWDVPPTAPAPGTKRSKPCASWRTWGALTGVNEVSKHLLGLPDEYFLLVGIWNPQPQHQGPKGVAHIPPGGLQEHLQGQMRYQKIYWDSKVKICFIGWDVPPTTSAPGTRRCRLCANWRPGEHIQSAWDPSEQSAQYEGHNLHGHLP